jgi:hypothetical protein
LPVNAAISFTEILAPSQRIVIDINILFLLLLGGYSF